MKKSLMVLLSALLIPTFPAAHAESHAETHEQHGQEVSVEINIYDDGSIVESGSESDRIAGETSTKLSNGRLSHRANNCNYVRVSYVKNSGTPINL